MKLPEPDDLDLSHVPAGLQARNDAFLSSLYEDPDVFEDRRRADSDLEVYTPDEYLGGSVWAPQTHTNSTTNPERPRTLTSGYDPKKFILTVQFRDGTLWNYYDVNPATWDLFKNADSKNDFIKNGPLSGWTNMGPVTGASPSTNYRNKQKGILAKKQQNKTWVNGVSRQGPGAW